MRDDRYGVPGVPWEDVQHYALFSGGHDSLAATAYAMEQDSTTAVLHIDTGTGIDENVEYVKRVCQEQGWPLRVVETPEDYVKLVKQYGFPGPQLHYIFYQRLKDRPLTKVAQEGDRIPHFWTGVRRAESQRRMVTKTEAVSRRGEQRWVWVSTILGWDGDDVREYIDTADFSRNPVVDAVHRSGECFCGAYAYRDEELLDLQANYPDHYDWLMDVEQQVIEHRGEDDHTSYWGHGQQSSPELQRLAEQYDDLDMKLCRSCEGGPARADLW